MRVAYFDNVERGTENASKALDRNPQRREDLGFAVGVAFALALPRFVGIGIYIATSVLLQAR
jgi:hypothetical protein